MLLIKLIFPRVHPPSITHYSPVSCCSHAPCVEVPGTTRGLGRRAADAAADLQRPGGRGEDN